MNTALSLIPDWSIVKQRAAEEWAADMLQDLRKQVDWICEHYHDEPQRTTGWGHQFYCRDCSAMLDFHIDRPGSQQCANCGSTQSNEEIEAAWAYMYRDATARHLFHAAVLYKLDENPKYLNYIRTVLDFYCTHYGQFPVLTPPGQEGTFAGTDLCDAVAAVWMINGMEIVKDAFTAMEYERYKTRFFIPLAEFLIVKVGCTPNINCWMKAAAGMIGLFFNERHLADRSRSCDHGIDIQLEAGMLDSGFWFEGSMLYHFYCAQAMTPYLGFCQLYEYEYPALEQALLAMYRFPVPFAFANGQFPSPNDGWPFLSFADYAVQYEWIRRFYDEPSFRYALARCYDGVTKAGQQIPPAPGKQSIHHLLLSTGDYTQDLQTVSLEALRVSIHDPAAKFAMLRKGSTEVFFKYGFTRRGHSHADVMNFELFFGNELVSRDISNGGYASDLFREWQRKSIAHNTVMVDQATQPERPSGMMLHYDAEDVRCSARAEDVYPGITYERSLHLIDEHQMNDQFLVMPSDGELHTFDWFFHCSGTMEHQLALLPCAPPGQEDGYSMMMDVASCHTDQAWTIRWTTDDGNTVNLSMPGVAHTEIYVFRGYEHRLDVTRWGVMVRRRGTQASFDATYHLQ